MHGSEAWENLIAPDAASIRGADLVLVNSRYTLRRYERLYGPLAKAIVCPLATEADAPPTRRAQFEGQPKVLIVGRIDEREGRKGHARLLKVWPRVAAAVPNARLVIAGGGSGLAALRKMVASLSCGDLIDVLGFVPEEALQDLYSEAHVFAMPSQQEGFGIAYVEAMRHGLPVIASLQDAGQEVNIDGLTGYNVDLERDGELADRLIRLLQERDQAAAMGSAGFDHWTRNYRFAEFADRLLAILGPWLQERGTA
jgi:phosphatidylinositol alpha-1,6-mannosyltransferase